MITDLDRKRAFKVQYDKTYSAISEIFDPIFEKIFQEVEVLYQQCMELLKDDYVYWVLVGNGVYLYRSEEAISKEAHKASIKQRTGLFTIPTELEPEVEKLSIIVKKLQQDVRIIQQWLSLFNCSNIEYEIPKGKEKFWKTVEDLLQYYAGLRLVL